MRGRQFVAIGAFAALMLAGPVSGLSVRDPPFVDDVGPGWSPAPCPETGQAAAGPSVCFAPNDPASEGLLAIGAVPVDLRIDPRVHVETYAAAFGGEPFPTPGLSAAAGRVSDFGGQTVMIVLIAGEHAYTLILTTDRPPDEAQAFLLEVARRQEAIAGRPGVAPEPEPTAPHPLDRLLVLPPGGSSLEVARTLDAPGDLSGIGSQARSAEVAELLEKAPTRMRILAAGGVPLFFVVLSEQPYDEFAATGLGSIMDSGLEPLELDPRAVPDAVGFRFPANRGGTMGIAFRQGRYLAYILTPSPGADEEVATRGLTGIAQLQANRLPSGDTAPYFFPSTATSIAVTAGLTTAISGGALALGRMAAGHRRRRTRGKGAADGGAEEELPRVEDVTRAAGDLRRRGTVLLVVDVLAMNAIVVGTLALTDVVQVPAALAVGLLLTGALGGVLFTAWWARSELRRREDAKGFPRELHPSAGAVAGGAVALVLLVLGLGFAATGLAGVTFGPSLSGLERSQSLGVEPTVLNIGTLVLGVLLLVLGGFGVRLARMRARVSAERLRARDPRRPVLYLRSFEDDDLMLPAVLSARRPFLELFAVRGSDPFEESIAWQVAAYGPVVAIGRPGRSTASLGAARDLLPDHVWRQGVSERMAAAGAIIVTIGSTDGLRWEMAQLVSGGYLDRTVFVVPPTDDAAIRERWRFTTEGLNEAGAKVPDFRVAPERVLAAAAVPAGGWWVAVGNVRDEATYRVALDRALTGIARLGTHTVPARVPSDPSARPTTSGSRTDQA
jgi:hypothetical protein